MKLKINVPFTDKYTKASYELGEIVEFTEDRAKELLEDGRKLVVKAENEVKEHIVEPVTDAVKHIKKAVKKGK